MRLQLCFLVFCGLTALASTGCNRDSSADAEVVEIFDESLRSDPAIEQTARASNEFAFTLFDRLDDGQNVCISPFSVASGLSMSMAGAGGTTLDEMKNVLHVGDVAVDDWHAGHGRITAALNAAGRGDSLRLSVANRIWLQNGLALQPAFRSTLEEAYQSSAATVNFGNQKAASEVINRWVAKVTGDRIPASITADDVSSDTAILLTNAIYFKARWKVQFDESHTENGEFKTLDGTVSVPFMHHEKLPARSGWSDGVRFVELLYRGGALSIVLLVPNKRSPRLGDDQEQEESPHAGLDRLEKLIGDRFDDWLANIYEGDLRVSLPRFKFATTAKLQSALESLGMPTAFSPQADFRQMIARSDTGDNANSRLWLDDVLHSTFIEVNEEGTEAAAVTHNPHVKSAVPLEFVVDRPFLFVIRENSTGLILFLGRVVDPSKG